MPLVAVLQEKRFSRAGALIGLSIVEPEAVAALKLTLTAAAIAVLRTFLRHLRIVGDR